MENDDRPNFFKLSELNNNPEMKIKNEGVELNHGQMGQIITSGGLQVRTDMNFLRNIYGILDIIWPRKYKWSKYRSYSSSTIESEFLSSISANFNTVKPTNNDPSNTNIPISDDR